MYVKLIISLKNEFVLYLFLFFHLYFSGCKYAVSFNKLFLILTFIKLSMYYIQYLHCTHADYVNINIYIYKIPTFFNRFFQKKGS